MDKMKRKQSKANLKPIFIIFSNVFHVQSQIIDFQFWSIISSPQSSSLFNMLCVSIRHIIAYVYVCIMFCAYVNRYFRCSHFKL